MFFEGKRFLYCFYVKEKAVILLKLHKGYLGLLQLLYDLVCKVEEGNLFEVSAYLREVSEGQFEQTVCIDNFLYQTFLKLFCSTCMNSKLLKVSIMLQNSFSYAGCFFSAYYASQVLCMSLLLSERCIFLSPNHCCNSLF